MSSLSLLLTEKLCPLMAYQTSSKMVLKFIFLLSLILVTSHAPRIDARQLERLRPKEENGKMGNNGVEMVKFDKSKAKMNLGEMKFFPFPYMPLPPIPFTPIPFPQFPFPPPLNIPNIPPIPNFPLPPFPFPPMPFLSPPPA